MIRHAVVKDGAVLNIVEYDQAIDGPMPGLPDRDAIASEIAQIGWTYTDGVFEGPPQPPEPPAPVEVLRIAYLKAALAQINKLDAVNAAVSDPVLKVLWESATEMRRDDPNMAAVAIALAIDLDDLWSRAKAIRSAYSN